MADTLRATAPSLGERLDAMIGQVDNLSTTQLYGLIVAATVALCIVLLGTGQHDVVIVTSDGEELNELKPQLIPPSTTAGQRQPRWHIFKYVNVLAICSFVASVVYFGWNAAEYMENSNGNSNVLAKFLIGWSVFLCYFFGFFGVSLIHDDIPKEQQQPQVPAERYEL
jgi:hypothetical protein